MADPPRGAERGAPRRILASAVDAVAVLREERVVTVLPPAIGTTVRRFRHATSRLLLVAIAASLPLAPTAHAARQPPPTTVVADGGAGGYEAFPDVARLPDGRLMAVFYAGYDHVSPPTPALPLGGRISSVVSSDGGRTWSAPAVLEDGPADDRDPSIAVLASGRILLTWFVNSVGLQGTFLKFSDDGGTSWSAPSLVSGTWFASSPVRELSDGRLVLGLYTERDGLARGAVTTSDDGGATWGPVVEIPTTPYDYLDAETDVIELSDGSLYAALRGRKRLWWSRSFDGGATWAVPESFSHRGHSPYLHRTADGVIVLGRRLPRTCMTFSVDETASWSPTFRIDGRAPGAYPSMTNLPDGSVLVVYYEEGPGSDVFARRFRITPPRTVSWLAP